MLGSIGDVTNRLPDLTKVLLRFRESRRIYSALGAVREKMKPEKCRFEGKADPRVQIFGGGDWETPKGLIDAAACDG